MIKERLEKLTGGAPFLPLGILFGLNAVDELDRSAFAVLVPEIRDSFGLDNEGILTVIGLVFLVALGIQPLIGFQADRRSRVRIAAAGAGVWALFSFVTGIAPVIAVLVIARSMTGIGRAVNDPTHNSLLADYYDPSVRTGVYGFHRAANYVGLILGPAIGGALAYFTGTWRTPFIVFSVPTALLVVLAVTKLREPIRGVHERRMMGASEDAINTEEVAPSFAEGWRICNQVQTLRRIWLSLPFLAIAVVGLGSLKSIYYEDEFGLNEFERGLVSAVAEPFQLISLALGIPILIRVGMKDPGRVLKLLAFAGVATGISLSLFAAAPSLPLAVAFDVLTQVTLGVIFPGVYATLSLAIPPRARSLGFSIGALYILPGALSLGIVGGLADDAGIRAAMFAIVPIIVIGCFVLASAGQFVANDIAKVRASTVAQAEVLAARRRGEAKLLLVKELDAGYSGVQILFGVDFEVAEGEIIALLGTNGAGKSTLLKAISGVLPATAGAVIFDGQDVTYATPQEVAAKGIVQVPGGKGVFPTLTVEENLRIAGWLYKKDKQYLEAAIAQVLEYFPVLKERWEQPAGNLSGGEQQMLTLSQAFIAKPRLLMIDELSLGLAPIIVEQLLKIVRAIRDRGTTIILVEQSVNVALTVAQTAYFLEKGEIRFKGPTAELLERPDVLRSVFLEGAGSVGDGDAADGDGDAANGNGNGNGKARVRSRMAELPFADRPIALEVRGLVKSFGGIRATDDVSFTLAEGEILGLIGPNGAGKTTIFDEISGFVPLDSGRVLLGGVDVTEAGPDARARAGLGRSFQDAKLFPALTVAETIATALEGKVEVRDPVAAALNLPAVAESEANVKERVDELIELMGLQAFADKFVSELSTGSRRIVDLACILAHEPKVILFDEPSSGIAQRETEALGPLLLRIREQTGASILVIEHDMPLITSISDRILALDLGHVVTDGPPHEVVNHPQVVASYLGTTEEVISRSGAAKDRPARASRRRAPTAPAAAGARRTTTTRGE